MKDSGGAGAKRPRLPPRIKEAKGDPSGLEFGWHHEAKFALVPKPWDGSVIFTEDMAPPPVPDAGGTSHETISKRRSIMAKMTPRTLSGFMELLPAPQQQMERIMEVLRRTYALYGFTPLDTPVIESSEVLLAKGGGETEKQIYRFTKGDADLALRFDLTVPPGQICGPALQRSDLPLPPLSNRKGLSGRACPAGPLPGILSGGHRHHRRRQALHHQRSGDPRHHLQDLFHTGPEALPDPGEQPEDPQRILCHAGPDRAVRRHHAHGGQAGQDRRRKR